MSLISMGNNCAAVEKLDGVNSLVLLGDLIQIGTADNFADQVWALLWECCQEYPVLVCWLVRVRVLHMCVACGFCLPCGAWG